MVDSRQAARRPVRAPLGQRSRRRWAIAGGVAACWLAAEVITGSFAAATVVVVAAAALGVVVVAGLRAMGITRDHPWLRRAAERPWRDGQDVLGVALRHLPEVFVVTPSGSLFAPEFVELQMNPTDIASLREWMELDALCASATEAYEDQVAKHGARFAGPCQPEVYLVPDHSLPQGRYRIRRGLPTESRYSPDAWDLPDVSGPSGASDAPNVRDQRYTSQGYAATSLDPVAAGSSNRTRLEVNPGRTVMDGMATVMEQIRPAIPPLRLVTGSSVTGTSKSGARAGRGMVELELPDVPTVSRVHATFTFAEGHWWVANQGMNGLSVNGVTVSGKHAVSNGDSIRWGSRADAPVSKVEIG